MLRQANSLLGIDINLNEICVVEVAAINRQVRLVRAGSTRTPRNSMDGDQITDTHAISGALKGLISRMGVSTRNSVMGIGPQSIITHVLEVPQVPDDELRTVVDGELAHLRVLPGGTGVFDFSKLKTSGGSDDSGPQVLVMAAEGKTLNTAVELAGQSGIGFQALEPSLMGIFRAGFSQVSETPSAAYICLSYRKAEIAILDHGEIRLYRRADIGTDDVFKGRREAAQMALSGTVASRRVMLGETTEEKETVETVAGGQIWIAKAADLATEIKRSIDYYRREYPRATPITRVFLGTNDPEAQALGPFLSEALNTKVTLADPALTIPASSEVENELAMPLGLKYMAAIGLALHDAIGPSPEPPRFDLGTGRRMSAEAEVTRKSILYSVAITLVILVAGLFAVLIESSRANSMETDVAAKRSQLKLKLTENAAKLSNIHQQEEQVAQLKSRGFAVPKLMDEVTVAVPSSAGLTSVDLSDAGKLTVQGEAGAQAAIPATVVGLQRSPYFTNVVLDSFETITSGNATVWKFQITAQLTGVAAPVKP